MKPSPYLLKVTLKKTPKLIWRRFVVPSDTRLDRLHEILQSIMGWTEPRPHAFFHKKQGFFPTAQVSDGGLPESKTTLANLIVRSGGKLKYTHDPAGEQWVHEIVVEDIRFSDPAWPFPVCCTAGIRACPPVNVGGVDGFAHLLRVLDGKADDAELKARFADFRPDHFDLESVNRTFGVDGPRHIVQKALERPKPAAAKQSDPFQRLGKKLKMLAQSEVE